MPRPPLPSALYLERHRGSLQELAPVWDALLDPTHPGAAFRSFAWISAWWSSVDPSAEAQVLLARGSDGAVQGLLPLYVEPTALGGRRVRLMGDGLVGSDYLGVISRSEIESPVALACSNWLQSNGTGLLLDGLLEDDPLVRALRDPNVAVEARYHCPRVRIEGSFEAYLAGLPGGAGGQWRRRRRWLAERPGYSFQELDSPTDVARGLEILFDLHRRRWALEGGSDGIVGQSVEAFHRRAASAFAARGWARVFLLYASGAPRAALYGFQHGDRFVFYQSGHEPAWRPRSVGTVLLGLILERCFHSGLREFDFLHGSEAYKLQWANGERRTVRLRARGRGLLPLIEEGGEALWHRVRAGARRALPDVVVSYAQRLRRAGA